MKPWVKWMIKHKLAYFLFVILIIAIPLVALYVIACWIPKFLTELYEGITGDWAELWNEVKLEQKQAKKSNRLER